MDDINNEVLDEWNNLVRTILGDTTSNNPIIESEWFKANGYRKFEVKRKFYTAEQNKYKIAEVIKFNNSSTANPMAICIGYNPAKAEEEVDVSNKRLIRLLKDRYQGYYLLNLYPQITKNVLGCDVNDSINAQGLDILARFLKNTDYAGLDIILFFGRTAKLTLGHVDLLNNQLKVSRKISVTIDKNKRFIHISRTWKKSLREIQKFDFTII